MAKQPNQNQAAATNAPATNEEGDQQADSANGGGIDNPATE